MTPRSYKAVVKVSQPETGESNIHFLKLDLPFCSNKLRFGVRPEAGQFALLKPLNNRSVMPRPFSIVDYNGYYEISFLIKNVGKNTEAYTKLQPGDEVEFYGLLGKGIRSELGKPKLYCFLVGGGIGAAGLVLLAEELNRSGNQIITLLGGRTIADIAGISFFPKYGNSRLVSEKRDAALVTDRFGEVLFNFLRPNSSIVVACGPRPMLHEVAKICSQAKVKCIIIVEELMACGIGSCKGCAVFGKDGSVKYVCTDGPAFDAGWIDWDRFDRPSQIPASEVHTPWFYQGVIPTVKIGDVKLESPVINCSGTLGVETVKNDPERCVYLGALVTKGVTLNPRIGNEMPRVCETPAGMLNAIGLENVGLKAFLKNEMPIWFSLGKPVIVNISGNSVEEYEELAIALDKTDITGIEVNISCPNIKKGDIIFGTDPNMVGKITRAVREKTSKFVIVKLTPNVADIVSIARAAVENGADAISLINTVKGMAINPYTGVPKLANVVGGLSGPAIRPIAVQMVYELYKSDIGVPIIGMGGIEDADSAAELMIVGATVVAAGTGNFKNPDIFSDICKGLVNIANTRGFSQVSELTGNLKRS